MKHLLAMALLGTFLVIPAQARTAGELKTKCLAAYIQTDTATQAQEQDFGDCLGYIHGFIETLSAYIVDLGGNAPGAYSYTIAPDTTIIQSEQVFMSYIKAHPEREKDYSPIVLRDALCEAGLLSEAKVPAKTAAPPAKPDKGCKQTSATCLPT
jgi:hypothetical protein